MKKMILKCPVLMTFELSRSAISRKGALKELKKRFKRPAAGEKKMGFEPFSGLSNTPPGVGGGPRICWLKVIFNFFDGLEPYGLNPI